MPNEHAGAPAPRWRSVPCRIAAALILVSPGVVHSLGAQAARIGRLPVLAPLPASAGACRNDSVNAELRSVGIVRLVSFTVEDSASHRLVGVGVDGKGTPRLLMATMGTRQGRRGESESVTVFFGANDTVIRGDRLAFTTGTATRLSDDRSAPLFPTDRAQARALARALRQRCRSS